MLSLKRPPMRREMGLDYLMRKSNEEGDGLRLSHEKVNLFPS